MLINKRFLLLALLAGMLQAAPAQLAKWLVQPNYDHIELLDCGLIKVKNGRKIGLLNSKGEELLKPIRYDSITTFNENYALLYEEGKFTAFVNMDGIITDVSTKGYTVPANAQFFSSGHLMVIDTDNRYNFINTKGEKKHGPYASAQPFFDGFAAVKSYVDIIKKPDETINQYIKAGGSPATLPDTNADDVSFLSSFHKNKALAVIKKTFYKVESNGGILSMTPLSVDSTTNKKSHVVAASKEITPLLSNGQYMVGAKNGKFTFDGLMRLKLMELMGNDPKEIDLSNEQVKKKPSSFSPIREGKLYGLNYRGKMVLPAQFEQITAISGPMAVVSTGNGYGVLTIDEDATIRFKMNNNENIGFIHRSYETDLAVILPSFIKCQSAIVTSKSDDCDIQIETRTEKENVEGNTIGYKCRLNIPQDLTDLLSKHNYQFAVRYEGLNSVDYNVSINEWYVKSYEVQLKKSSMTISKKDSVMVEFDLVKTRDEETTYYKEVSLESPDYGKPLYLNKITEDHFSFNVSGVDNETVTFAVKITEVGCPPIIYPFVMSFESKDKKSTNIVINTMQRKNFFESGDKKEEAAGETTVTGGGETKDVKTDENKQGTEKSDSKSTTKKRDFKYY